MRILCLDIGTKRIGVAVSDPMGWTAQPVKVILRRSEAAVFSEIVNLCQELEVLQIVIGIPLNEDGNLGPAAEKIKDFSNRIEKHLDVLNIDIPVELWDERYSTATAEERLIDADVSRSRRKKVIDKMAAVVILEDYLRAHEANSDSEGVEG